MDLPPRLVPDTDARDRGEGGPGALSGLKRLSERLQARWGARPLGRWVDLPRLREMLDETEVRNVLLAGAGV